MRKIREQWVEQDGLVAKFQVPYFWTVGNHDMWDKPSGQYYADCTGRDSIPSTQRMCT